MADTKTSPATLLDELAPSTPRSGMRWPRSCGKVAETFAEEPDGRDTAHTLGLLAHLLDSD